MRKTQPLDRHSRAPQKDRAVWFHQKVSFPLRDASPVQLEKFWASQLQADISPEHRWECAGPFNVAGRVTPLVIHPHKSNMWFAGSATGGVWMSADAGESWHHLEPLRQPEYRRVGLDRFQRRLDPDGRHG
jgi:hypothetical protein